LITLVFTGCCKHPECQVFNKNRDGITQEEEVLPPIATAVATEPIVDYALQDELPGRLAVLSEDYEELSTKLQELRDKYDRSLSTQQAQIKALQIRIDTAEKAYDQLDDTIRGFSDTLHSVSEPILREKRLQQLSGMRVRDMTQQQLTDLLDTPRRG
jgi:septal ring factor EnvC (AmiA/AmiB activator)